MISEIKRGVDICQQITNNQSEWSVLFEPRNFFNDYKYLNKNDLKFKIRVLFAFWKNKDISLYCLLVQMVTNSIWIGFVWSNLGYEF